MQACGWELDCPAPGSAEISYLAWYYIIFASAGAADLSALVFDLCPPALTFEKTSSVKKLIPAWLIIQWHPVI